MGFFSGIVSAVKSIVSSVKGVISAVGKALTTGKPSDVNNAITQIDNTINEVDKLIKLLEGPKKQKITTGAEDSGILPTWDEVKGFFQRKENEISDYIIKEKNYIGAVIYKKAEAAANNPFLHPVISRVEMLYNFEKNTLLRTMAESNGQVGPDGMVYATEDQAKLADAGAGQLTGEAVGGVIGVAINGIKSYNIVKNGEKLSSEFVAGSGIGGAAGKGVREAETISHPVLEYPRVGSGLKNDPYHDISDIIDNYAKDAQRFDLPNKKGHMDDLYQIEGSIVKYKTNFDKVKNNAPEMSQTKEILDGVFEWVVDPTTKTVTHRTFIPGGKVSGKINQWGK